MLKHYITAFIAVLILCSPQPVEALSCIDGQWTSDAVQKLQNDKEQFDIMKKQSEYMQEMMETLGEGSSGFATSYLKSLSLPVHTAIYVPGYSKVLEQIKPMLEKPDTAKDFIIDVFGLKEAPEDVKNARDISAGEVKAARSDAAMLAAKDAYAAAILVQSEMSSIGDVVDVLADENADTVKADLGVNTGMLIEMVHQLNTTNVLLSSGLELEATMGFIGAPVY